MSCRLATRGDLSCQACEQVSNIEQVNNIMQVAKLRKHDTQAKEEKGLAESDLEHVEVLSDHHHLNYVATLHI